MSDNEIPPTDQSTPPPLSTETYYLSFDEANAEWLFSEQKINTEEELLKIVGDIFDKVCGEHGRDEFFQFVFPQILKIYGSNYRKAGLRLLEIINKGAEQKIPAIGGYFKEAVSELEIQFSEKPKEEITQEVCRKIEDILIAEKNTFGEHYPFAGVLIYGSIAKRNMNLQSDIDCIIFANGNEAGVYVETEDGNGKYVRLTERLMSLIENATGFEVQLNAYIPAVNISSPEILTEFGKILQRDFNSETQPFIVVSPDASLRAKIEEIGTHSQQS